MKGDWYILVERATHMVDSGQQLAEARNILESIVKKEPLTVKKRVKRADGRERAEKVDNPVHFLPRLLLTRIHMRRADLYAKMQDNAECKKAMELAGDQLEFMHENAKNLNIREYANAGLDFLEGNTDLARKRYLNCRRPTKSQGWIMTALKSRTRGYIRYAWNKGQMSKNDEEKAWTKLREEMFNQTESQLKRLMRSTQKMTAIAKSRTIDTLVLGGAAAAVIAGLYTYTPDLEEMAASAEPAVQEQAAVDEPEEEALNPTAKWEREGRYVRLLMQYSNGTEVPPTEVARMIYFKKERGKRLHRFEFIPEDDVEEFSRKIKGKRPVKYWAEIYLESGNTLKTDPITVR